MITAVLNPRVVAELADAPLATVQEAFHLARTTPGVRDPARWVVGVLRARKAQGWVQPAPPDPPKRVSDTPIVLHPQVCPQERARWLRRFRNAEPHERPAVLARFFAEYPLEETYDHAA